MDTEELVEEIEEDIEEFGAVVGRIIGRIVELYNRGEAAKAGEMTLKMYTSMMSNYSGLQEAYQEAIVKAKEKIAEAVAAAETIGMGRKKSKKTSDE